MSAPDTSARMQQGGKVWKPELQDQVKVENPDATIIGTSSTESLDRPGLNSREDEKDVRRSAIDKFVPFRKIRSEDPIRSSNSPQGPETTARAVTTTSRVLQSPAVAETGSPVAALELVRKRRMTFEDVKNKPLPRIAAL
ncbi:hypothetical protein N0V90_008641 [Kalmusia sp. IMI 367209]|nr:hypothetical protein N0V90_008641 [Kalmusia sp. IMI 367209]